LKTTRKTACLASQLRKDKVMIEKLTERTNLVALGNRTVFEPTDWGTVKAASQREAPHWLTALDSLCRTYWHPLYSFLRHQGYTAAEAKDLTQGFFVLLLEKNFIETASPEKGRFRSFLLGALKKFVSNQRQKEMAVKRGREIQFIPLDFATKEEAIGAEPSDGLTPDKLFARRWALTVLEEANRRLKEEYAKAGKEGEYRVLSQCLDDIKPASGYKALAAQLQLKEGAFRVRVHRLKIRYALAVRQVIAETVAAPAEVEQELRELQKALGK